MEKGERRERMKIEEERETKRDDAFIALYSLLVDLSLLI